MAECAADAVGARLGDGNKGVRGGLFRGVLIGIAALAVGVAAIVIIHIVVVDYLAADGNTAFTFARSNSFTVHGYAIIGKDDLFRVGIFGLSIAPAADAALTPGIASLLSIASGKCRKAKR